MNSQPTAFVLMPFDAEFLPIYEQLIKPALEKAGYAVTRADSFLHQQSILKDIVRNIAEAGLVVADLTALNPNVLYELGLSHGLRVPTILISQSMEDVPFDLRPYRVILYDTRFDLASKLANTLADIASQHVAGTISFGSPVADYLRPPDEPPKAILANSPQMRHEVALPPQLEKGFLDFLVDGEDAASAINETLTEITADIVGVGTKMNQHTATIKAMSENPGPGVAVSLSRLSSQVAADMHSSAQTLERMLPPLEENVSLLEESYTGYVNWFTPENDEQTKILRKFRDTLASLHEASKRGLPNIAAYRDAVFGLRGISADIGAASRRLSHQLDGLAAITEKLVAFAARTVGLVEEKLAGRQPRA